MNSWTDKFIVDSSSGVSLDLSYAELDFEQLSNKQDLINQALSELSDTEKGKIANQDENRMVGHYWLRASELSPNQTISEDIEKVKSDVKQLAQDIITGKLLGSKGLPFTSCLLIGIGGSALGPQFLEQALSNKSKSLKFFYFDNTDPAGFLDTWTSIPDPSTCLVLVVSKSGGTRETRNGMLFAKKALGLAGCQPAKHMLAITQQNSMLDKYAQENKWLARIPMWDWVGGRVSLWSAVGLLPAHLQGIDCEQLLSGAAHMDTLGRNASLNDNPALALALTWYIKGNARGDKLLVMLPYRDQLVLLSKYLQQLIMESIGKELDRDGNKVNQGLYVLGNKGSTDQHSYIQQLREGPANFLAHFIEVLDDTSNQANSDKQQSFAVLNSAVFEENATCGDYLSGFFQGTRQALFDNGRASVTITIPKVNAYYIGMLLSLFERAVSFYASFINVNAYHQPGVEAGKKGAAKIIDLQSQILKVLAASDKALNAAQIASALDLADVRPVFYITRHLAANNRLKANSTTNIFETEYYI